VKGIFRWEAGSTNREPHRERLQPQIYADSSEFGMLRPRADPKIFIALVPPSSNREWKPEAGFEGEELLWLRDAA
jgi:hypothetical protein